MPAPPSLAEIRAEKCRRSLADFIRYGWETVEPGTPLAWNWHIDAIAEHLEAVSRGEIKRLLINIPPGHMKSLIVAVFWPAWEWIEKPETRSLFGSYAQNLAIRDSVRCRDLVMSDWYREWFEPGWILKADQNEKGYFVNSKRGFRFSLSVGGQGTGWRGHKVVVDDPLNAKEAASEAKLDEAAFWYDKTLSSRLNDMRTGARVLIMQRLAEGDPSGRIIARGGYECLVLPSEFDPARRARTCIGWEDPRTEKGELLFPEMFPPEVIAEVKKDLGSDGFAGQHQQLPAPAEGLIFKADWFGLTYRKLPDVVAVWSTIDTALKAKEENDESAIVSAAQCVDGNLYLLYAWHGREETPDLGKRVIAHDARLRSTFGDKYLGSYIEDKVSGTTLMQYLRRSNPQLVLIPVHVEADKVARAKGVTPMCEAGRVILPDLTVFPAAADWVRDLIALLLMFPKGDLDDLVDAFVYTMKKFMGTLATTGKKARKSKRGGAA